ncbi:MAG: TatD family hydrolase [Chitinophagaceae bacterium]
MMLIDSHTHLYGEEFDGDRREMIARSNAAGVQKFYLPGIDSTAIDSMLQMELDFPGQCHAMMGLHPCYVKENWQEELLTVAQWLGKRNFAAVGEIGLDFYWDTSFKEQQYEAFHAQIGWALQYDLPIVIHTRNAMSETIEVVKSYAGKGLHGIFHCFGGSLEEANEIINAGFYLGIGGVLTYKKSGLAEVLANVPLQHLVLETDAPYLTPVPFRGKRNESSYLKYVVDKLVEVYSVSADTIATVTTANAASIFK